MSFGRICVFCGSSPGRRPEYAEAAAAMGALLAARGLTLVYGGGRVGLMGAVADAVLAAGGRVVGVIPEAIATKEVAHRGVTELHVVPSMHARKALMAELADAFIALPGGFGTFEELFEIVTWAQLGIHAKPLGLLNVAGYFDGLKAMVDHAAGEGFIDADQRDLIAQAAEPEALLALLAHHRPRPLRRWVRPEET
jgi:uncharacterized protein (TIGR00730 family)